MSFDDLDRLLRELGMSIQALEESAQQPSTTESSITTPETNQQAKSTGVVEASTTETSVDTQVIEAPSVEAEGKIEIT